MPPATVCGKCDAPAAASPAPAVPEKSSGFSASSSGVFPSKNVPALASYYFGLFSIVPYLGLVLAPLAIALGLLGLKRASQRPEIRGKAHAWTGIVAAIVLGTVGHLLRGKADLLYDTYFGPK